MLRKIPIKNQPRLCSMVKKEKPIPLPTYAVPLNRVKRNGDNIASFWRSSNNKSRVYFANHSILIWAKNKRMKDNPPISVKALRLRDIVSLYRIKERGETFHYYVSWNRDKNSRFKIKQETLSS